MYFLNIRIDQMQILYAMLIKNSIKLKSDFFLSVAIKSNQSVAICLVKEWLNSFWHYLLKFAIISGNVIIHCVPEIKRQKFTCNSPSTGKLFSIEKLTSTWKSVDLNETCGIISKVG